MSEWTKQVFSGALCLCERSQLMLITKTKQKLNCSFGDPVSTCRWPYYTANYSQMRSVRRCLCTWEFSSRIIVHVCKTCLRSIGGGGGGAGIAQWLEHRTRDWKAAGSNPCWNGGRIFFSRVDFLCWLLFRYPFHPRVTTVARKKSRSFCQKCRWQVTAKHAYTLRMWILLNRASALVTTCP